MTYELPDVVSLLINSFLNARRNHNRLTMFLFSLNWHPPRVHLNQTRVIQSCQSQNLIIPFLYARALLALRPAHSLKCANDLIELIWEVQAIYACSLKRRADQLYAASSALNRIWLPTFERVDAILALNMKQPEMIECIRWQLSKLQTDERRRRRPAFLAPER